MKTPTIKKLFSQNQNCGQITDALTSEALNKNLKKQNGGALNFFRLRKR